MKQIIFVNDIEAEIKENEETSEKYFRLKSLVPFSITREKEEDNIQFALNLLCTNEANDMLILSTIFELDEEYADLEIEHLKYIPIYEGSQYTANIISHAVIKQSLDNYLTDFIFEYGEDKLSSSVKEFTFKAFNRATGELNNFTINVELYSAIRFYIEYITSMNYNLRLLSAACVSGADREEDNVDLQISIIKSIDNLVNLAKVDKKGNIAIVFECTDEDDEKYMLLTSFNLDYNISKRKTKGNTVKKIEKYFLQDKDQYMNTFSFSTYFNKDGKSYISIRAINNEKDCKLFLINKSCQEKILELINDR